MGRGGGWDEGQGALAARACIRLISELWQSSWTTGAKSWGISMTIALETLRAQVLRLSPADRARLLDRLIASLDADAEPEAFWDELAAEREQELATGVVAAVPLQFSYQLLYCRFDIFTASSKCSNWIILIFGYERVCFKVLKTIGLSEETIEAVLSWCEDNGGYCDGEAILNTVGHWEENRERSERSH